MMPFQSTPLRLLAVGLMCGSAAAALAQSPTEQPLPDLPQHPGKSAQPVLPASAGGKILVEEPLHDLGRIDRGQPLRHSFVVKNTGDGPLTISAKPG